ncbi:hypothetical protein EV702DRAFT_1073923, partial [Suillus placidus]
MSVLLMTFRPLIFLSFVGARILSKFGSRNSHGRRSAYIKLYLADARCQSITVIHIITCRCGRIRADQVKVVGIGIHSVWRHYLHSIPVRLQDARETSHMTEPPFL